MPTGVTVSHTGRVFVNYPHWGDPVTFTVAEIVNGQAVAYPNAQVNKINKAHPGACLYSVQSVVVDPKDRLWALDTGSLKLGPNVPGGPKLVCMDLKTNTITRKIFFPRSVVPASTYLNEFGLICGAARRERRLSPTPARRLRTALLLWIWRRAKVSGGSATSLRSSRIPK